MQTPTEARKHAGGRRRVIRWASLWRFMQRAGLSEETLAVRLNRTARGISCWVRGERLPALHFLPIIALALRIDSDPEGYEAEIQRELQADAPVPTPFRSVAAEELPVK